MIYFGKFFISQDDDFSFLNILQSPFYNLSEDEIFRLSINREKESLWSRFCEFYPQRSKKMKNLIKMSYELSVLELYDHLWKVVFCSDFHNRNSYGSDNSRFNDFAAKEEFFMIISEMNPRSLYYMIDRIEYGNFEYKNRIQGNSVRIMTIHSAKGLESRIVFLVDTTTSPRGDSSLLFDEKNTPFWVKSDRSDYCDRIKDIKKNQDKDEYWRLLYVAMTRAQDELYVLGYGKVEKESWFFRLMNMRE